MSSHEDVEGERDPRWPRRGAGTITLMVFREKKTRVGPPLDDKTEDLAAISRGVLSKERPQTLAVLRFWLRAGANLANSRGLIVEGQRISAAVRRVEFPPDPTPVMAATIT